ncbi:sodium:solute symporter, partial [Staphylococcus pseudintermedius]
NGIVLSIVFAYSILTGGIFMPFVLGLFKKRITPQASSSAIIARVIVILIGIAITGPKSTATLFYAILFNAIILIIMSQFQRKKEA